MAFPKFYCHTGIMKVCGLVDWAGWGRRIEALAGVFGVMQKDRWPPNRLNYVVERPDTPREIGE